MSLVITSLAGVPLNWAYLISAGYHIPRHLNVTKLLCILYKFWFVSMPFCTFINKIRACSELKWGLKGQKRAVFVTYRCYRLRKFPESGSVTRFSGVLTAPVTVRTWIYQKTIWGMNQKGTKKRRLDFSNRRRFACLLRHGLYSVAPFRPPSGRQSCSARNLFPTSTGNIYM